MVEIQLRHQRAASEIMEVKHQVVLEALRSRLDEIEVGYDSADEEELEKMKHNWKSIKGTLH